MNSFAGIFLFSLCRSYLEESGSYSSDEAVSMATKKCTPGVYPDNSMVSNMVSMACWFELSAGANPPSSPTLVLSPFACSDFKRV